MEQRRIAFVLERETKGAVRYQEQNTPETGEPTVGTLYVRKSAFGQPPYPETLYMTLGTEV